VSTNADNPAVNVYLEPRYDPGKSPEDVSFSKATPSGKLEFLCTNPAAIDQLKEGQSFYVDLIPIDE